MIMSRYLGSPPAPPPTRPFPLEDLSRRTSHCTGRLSTTPEMDSDYHWRSLGLTDYVWNIKLACRKDTEISAQLVYRRHHGSLVQPVS